MNLSTRSKSSTKREGLSLSFVINSSMTEKKVTMTNTFDSFCSRMWLDYEDEHITNPNRLTLDEYKEKWHDWLLKKWQKSNDE